MYNILFITCCPSPSRVDFFNHLGEDKSVNLTVVFMESEKEQHHRSSKWFKDNSIEHFKSILLSERVGLKNKQYYGYISKDIVKVLKKRYDEIIFGGYAYPTFMYGMLYLIKNKVPYSIEVDGGFISNDNIFKHILKSFFIGHADKWYSSGINTDQYLLHYGAKKKRIIHYPFTSLSENDFCRAWDYNTTQIKDFLNLVNSNVNAFYERKNQLKQLSKEHLNISSDKVIISIGQFIHRKGFDILLKSARRLDKNIKVIIIGGIAPQNYKRYIDEHSMTNVEFVDFLSKDELKYYFWAADLYVMPTRYDIWGLVINEAMAYGLPIISTDKCNSALELVSEENGYIIPSDDYEALLNAITNFFSQDNTAMGKNSLSKIKNYTIENMAKKHINIWNKENEHNT